MPNDNKKNQNLSFPTTLIIGLGGVGSRITTGIYKQFMSRNPKQDDKDNVICLCFDTDSNDIKLYKKDMPNEWVVQTSSTQAFTIGQYINKIKDITTVEDWFDNSRSEIIKMKLNDGAGQIRMASRLAYMSAISDGKLQAIDNSIRRLLKTDPQRHEGNDIKVHIICSLAGGTGAGSFLQTAYYVKDVMRSLNIDAPKILGYFVLGDVLCHDTDAGLNEKQKENTRANTYACMKELTAFINKDTSQSIKNIEFEYKIGQRDIGIPTCDPYDLCYMIDFTNSDGTNIGDMEVYYNQVKDFVYMNAFSPYGNTQRSDLINETLRQVQTEGKARFSAIGVSKMIFPVEDLYEYFATQRLVDNLSSTWVRIDQKYKQRYSEYKDNKRNSIPDEEPERGQFFLVNVEDLAKNGSGWEKTVFRDIYNSTQVTGKDGVSQGDKSAVFLEAVEEHIKSVIQNNKSLEEHYKNCNTPDRFGEDEDKDSDISFISKREEDLNNFRDYMFKFIESVKQGTIEQCFLVDASQPNRVSHDIASAQHHLNSYILQKDHELHPIAVRYFLYQVRDLIKDELENLKTPNESLKYTITDGYKKKFDITDDKLSPDKHEETAVERIIIEYKRKKIYSSKDLNEFKDTYLRESKKQRANILKYAEKKLTEYVLEGLLTQISRLIEESEDFFKRLPDTLRMLEGQCNDLLLKHDSKSDPTVLYVLSSKKIKQHLYKEIQKEDSLMFPNDISARIYRTMFDNTRIALEQSTSLGSLSEEEEADDAKEQLLIEANNRLFTGVIESQIRNLKRTSPQYVEMNIIQALKKEGELLSTTTEAASQYMKQKFDAVRDMAVIRGAYQINPDINRYINSWGFNNKNGLDDKDQEDFLFGTTDVRATPETAADHEPNPFYSPYELIRANSVNSLELETNFKGFSYKESDNNEDGHIGSYLKAYLDVNQRILDGEPDCSRHLDKRWQLPAYMPNIGTDLDETLKDIFSALYYGLLFGKFGTKQDSGEDYWYYYGQYPDYIADFNGWRIPLKGTNNLEAGLNDLLEKGLIENPSIVQEIMESVDSEWEAAKEEWQRTDLSSGDILNLMKELTIIKKMKENNYETIYSLWNGKGWKWFSFLSANNNTTLSKTIDRLKVYFFEELITRIIEVFGPSANTRKLCEDLFDSIPDSNMKAIALNKVKDLDQRHKFEISYKKR